MAKKLGFVLGAGGARGIEGVGQLFDRLCVHAAAIVCDGDGQLLRGLFFQPGVSVLHHFVVGLPGRACPLRVGKSASASSATCSGRTFPATASTVRRGT